MTANAQVLRWLKDIANDPNPSEWRFYTASLEEIMKVVAIDHVQLAMPAGAEGKARTFYGEILGLREIPKPAETASRGGVWFWCGGMQLHLGIESDFRPAKKAHPALTIEGYAELLKTLTETGYEVIEDTSLPAITRCYTFDPFGNRIELISTEGTL